MVKVTNFSKTQEILETNDWESLRIVDETSPTTKLVANKLREIVTRLLSKSAGQYNIDDFEFLVTDESEPNAFYISNTNTKNGKNIVSVSSALINFCKNEDELAGIVGHELGHFVYDKLSNTGKNTVFQERGSDLHSVDLLIDGGYSPLAYMDVAGRLFLKGKSDVLQSLGVHGSKIARVEDIRAYLTYLKKERGDFKQPGDAKSYKDFQTKFNYAFKDSRFRSYLDQIQLQKIGDMDLTTDNFSPFLDIITSEFQYGNLEYSARANDLLFKLNLYDENNRDTQPTKEIQEKLQTLAQLIIAKQQDADNKTILNIKIIDRLRWINKGRFKAFGVFQDFSNDLRKFIDAKNIDEAHKVAEEWNSKTNMLMEYKDTFDFPKFIMPVENNAVGTELPYTRHREWAKTDKSIDVFLDVFSGGREQSYKDEYLSGIKWPNDISYSIVSENGKIIMVGDAAKEHYKKLSEQSSSLKNKEKMVENHIHFQTQLKILNSLVDFKDGKISADDFWKIARGSYEKHHIENDPIYKIFQNFYVYIENNIYEQSDYNDAINSRAYNVFGRPSNKLQSVLNDTEQSLKDDNGQYYKTTMNTIVLDSIFRKNANINFLTGITDTLLNLINETTKESGLNSSDLMAALYKNLQFGFSGLIYGSYSYNSNEKYQITDEIIPVRDELLAKTRNEYTDVANPISWLYNFSANNLALKFETDQQFRNGENTILLDKVLNKLGVYETKDSKTFYSNIASLRLATKSYNREFVVGYYIAKCLRADIDIGNLKTFFEHVGPEPYINGEKFEQDELAKYITRHKIFPENDFNSAFDIYKSMDVGGWFSKEQSNQSGMLNMLIKHIDKMGSFDREKYSFMLLTGLYSDLKNSNYQRNSKNLRFPEQKNKLMEIFTNAILEQTGIDDGTPEYTNKIQTFTDLISKNKQFYFLNRYFFESLPTRAVDREDLMYEDIINSNGYKRKIFSEPDKSKLMRILSDKIVSQDKTSQLLAKNQVVKLSDKNAQSHDSKARAFEGALAFLEHNTKRAKSTIEFLNRRLTLKSIDQFRDEINDNSIRKEQADKYLNRESLEILHNSFWDEDLGTRSIVMNKLLNRLSKESDTDKIIHDQITYVCDLHFPKDDKYRKDAELIFETAIMAFEPFERSLILAAIASADENKDSDHKNASKSVGAGLRMFFENMGPAWVKFGQLLSYVPELPSEIREDLGKLKDKADIPARWDLFESIKNTLPNDLQKNIVRVDEVLGAGSFWITAKIQFVNTKTGRVEDKVLSLLRPAALERSRSGFKTIETAVKNLARKDGKYKSLLKVAQQAKASAEYEVDVVHGNKQFEKAKQLYGDIRVKIGDDEFTPNVADWEYYGVGRDAVGYKLMDMAHGKSLSRAGKNTDERRKMALAYVTMELTNLFKGDVWDIDRHMGQQNFNQDAPHKYSVNIFDTGAQMPNAPDKTDKILLAEVLYGIIRAARTGIPLDQQILKTIKNMNKLESYLKVDTSYVADVQKGLLALSDIIEYQKEIKDRDSNIIQERLTLSAEDLANAVEAVYANPSADTTIKMSLAGKVLLNKLRPLRKGWASSLNEGMRKNDKNPIQIEIIPYTAHPNSVEFNKPESEIADIDSKKSSEQILGINKKHIKQNPDIPVEILMRNKLREIA